MTLKYLINLQKTLHSRSFSQTADILLKQASLTTEQGVVLDIISKKNSSELNISKLFKLPIDQNENNSAQKKTVQKKNTKTKGLNL